MNKLADEISHWKEVFWYNNRVATDLKCCAALTLVQIISAPWP